MTCDVNDFLLNKTSLQVGDEVVRIVEVEIYQDPDPYIHGCPEQYTNSCWYFHKISKNGLPSGFKGGTYKGLDLTCGDANKAAGALIRSIFTSNGIIEGPCKVVNFILEKTNSSSIEELVSKSQKYPPECNDPEFPLRLISTLNQDIVYSSPRVGLSYSENKLRQTYLMMSLRFTTTPMLLKKQKCTLVISYLNSICSSDKLTEDDLKKAGETFKCSHKNIQKWWNDYCDGKREFGNITKMKTVQEICKVYGRLYEFS